MDHTPRSRRISSSTPVKSSKRDRTPRSVLPDLIKQSDQYKLIKRAAKVLKKQREQALKDIEIIKRRKAEILSDPDEYIYKLKNGTALSFPPPQKIIMVSDIIKSGQFDDLLRKIKDFREQNQSKDQAKSSTPSLSSKKARPLRERLLSK